VILQSNHEGALVGLFHKHMDDAAGAILNPGGLTQYSVSLHDCIKAMPFPVIEVHMSNLHAREEWRTHSIISPAVKGTVQGFGWRSYLAALRLAAELAQEKKK
jgi:3-dehydroquinate dehydratase II